MSLSREGFESKEIENACINYLCEMYYNFHKQGGVIGPIDFKNTLIKLNDGSVKLGSRMKLEDFNKSVDLIKFAPPEVNQRNGEWDIYSDLFCLDVLIFVVRYGAFPFDGMLCYKTPASTLEIAHKIYDNPIFIFDPENRSNAVSPECDSFVIKEWENEENESIKKLFIRAFTAGINNKEARVRPDEWSLAQRNGGVN